VPGTIGTPARARARAAVLLPSGAWRRARRRIAAGDARLRDDLPKTATGKVQRFRLEAR